MDQTNDPLLVILEVFISGGVTVGETRVGDGAALVEVELAESVGDVGVR